MADLPEIICWAGEMMIQGQLDYCASEVEKNS